MRWLLFLSKLAFVCNCFFLLAVSLQLVRWFRNEDAEALTLIIGFALAIIVNPATVLCYLFFSFTKRDALLIVPLWLRIANGLFLVLQVFYFFHLNVQ